MRDPSTACADIENECAPVAGLFFARNADGSALALKDTVKSAFVHLGICVTAMTGGALATMQGISLVVTEKS
ncbi:MAG: hypothetical protein V4550_08370 [Gemmatimonadota bacterium]